MRRLAAVVTRLSTLLLTLVLMGGLHRQAGAQLSPGALSRPHAALDGTLGCTKCHGGRRESTTSRCLACHDEIAWLVGRGRGLHAREAKGECASCHPDHAGRDFALIQWPEGRPERFDHERAGWRLDGSHAELACKDCHTRALRVSQAAALSPGGRGSIGGTWVGLERQCTACHTDVHEGSLTTAASRRQCTTCHDARKWKPARGFDHADTRYPLTGAHARVDCDGCHRTARLTSARDSSGRPLPVFRPLAFGDCASCHADPHAGRFAGRCASCHSTRAFRDVRAAGFDHDRTRYALRGKHAQVPCAGCHTGDGRRRTNPPFAQCASCHANAHGTQLDTRAGGGACESCHRVTGWAPSTFGRAEHASTALPLDGAHARATCGACHGAARRGLPLLTGRESLGSAGVALRLAGTACSSCHADPHDGRLSSGERAGCGACHDAGAFRPSSVDADAHSGFAYPLEGAHRAVPCAGCHQELLRPPARNTLVRGAPALAALRLTVADASRCASCHRDPHAGQFRSRPAGDGCDGCHSLASFAPAARFDHGRDTAFPLTDGHARVACASCHSAPAAAEPIRYRISTACESCHAGSGGAAPAARRSPPEGS